MALDRGGAAPTMPGPRHRSWAGSPSAAVASSARGEERFEREREAGKHVFARERVIRVQAKRPTTGPEDIGGARFGIDDPDQADTGIQILRHLLFEFPCIVAGGDHLDGEIRGDLDDAVGCIRPGEAADGEEHRVGLTEVAWAVGPCLEGRVLRECVAKLVGLGVVADSAEDDSANAC